MFKSIGKNENMKLSSNLLTAVMLSASCAELHPRRTSQLAVDPAYQQSFEKWKGDLVEDLKQEWLPLAGLFWLKPGENSFRH